MLGSWCLGSDHLSVLYSWRAWSIHPTFSPLLLICYHGQAFLIFSSQEPPVSWIIWIWTLYKWVTVKIPQQIITEHQGGIKFSIQQRPFSLAGDTKSYFMKLTLNITNPKILPTHRLHFQEYLVYFATWLLRQWAFISACCLGHHMKVYNNVHEECVFEIWQRTPVDTPEALSASLSQWSLFERNWGCRYKMAEWFFFSFWPTELLVSNLKGRLDPK